ncbi:MAG: hypothetical protein JNL75_07465 [Chitinophagales bacterium]|nr:hypothetical protein [Chitinophagales bacterium]
MTAECSSVEKQIVSNFLLYENYSSSPFLGKGKTKWLIIPMLHLKYSKLFWMVTVVYTVAIDVQGNERQRYWTVT